jgi:hypothetical protein
MSLALGGHALGSEPLAGSPLHDPPTVVVTTLGTISAGGPDMTIAWTYDQPQGDPQEQFRVEILNDALSTTHYDSGWIFGPDAQLVIDVDANLIPHESTDVTARVSVRGPAEIGIGDVDRYTASDVDAYVVQWGTPHCTITAPPSGTIVNDIDGITVSWSFADDRGGKIQEQYRVRLILTGIGLVVYDSGWVVSAATSLDIPTILNDGSQYTIEVQLKNDSGIRSD